jgi:hypothetical protein
VRVIVEQDLAAWTASSCSVTAYVWTVLKTHALCRELNQTLLEVERWARVLDSPPEADRLVAEAQTLLMKLECEADGDDDRRRS